jgi:hypothetical protein
MGRTNLLFDGHAFLYLSSSLQQSLPTAPVLRQIGEVDSALTRLTRGLKEFAIGLTEVDSAFMPKGIELLNQSFNHQ